MAPPKGFGPAELLKGQEVSQPRRLPGVHPVRRREDPGKWEAKGLEINYSQPGRMLQQTDTSIEWDMQVVPKEERTNRSPAGEIWVPNENDPWLS